jgi:hypothetical protein
MISTGVAALIISAIMERYEPVLCVSHHHGSSDPLAARRILRRTGQ